MSKDYLVEIKVKNNRLLQIMKREGYDSVVKLAAAVKMPASALYAYFALKQTPIGRDGAWKTSIIKLSEVLRCLPEDMFPPQHWERPLKKNVASFEADAPDIMAIAGSTMAKIAPPDEALEGKQKMELLARAMQRLPERVRAILEKLYFDNETLRTVGEGLDISPERVRQIEIDALRRLSRDPELKALFPKQPSKRLVKDDRNKWRIQWHF